MVPAGLATSRAKSMSNLASPFASLSDSEEKLPLGWACADNLTLKLPDVTVGNNVYRPSLSRPTLPSRSRHALNRCPTLACRQTSCCFRCNECRPVMLIETSTRPNNSPLFTFYSNPDSHSRTSPSNTCRALAKAPKILVKVVRTLAAVAALSRLLLGVQHGPWGLCPSKHLQPRPIILNSRWLNSRWWLGVERGRILAYIGA